MEKIRVNRPPWLVTFSLVSRITAMLFAGFVLFTMIRSGLGGPVAKEALLWSQDHILRVAWAIYVAGLLAGLKWEGMASLITLGMLVTHILYLSSEGNTSGTWILVMFIPSVLYALSWYFHRRNLQYK
jgi:hypothetical protein